MTLGMQGILFVGLGGFLGALARYGLGALVQRFVAGTFPLGTMLVNLLGCLLIGVLAGVQDARQIFSPEWSLFIFVGALGSFTTFSTFGLDAFRLLREGAFWPFGIYVGTQMIVGILSVFLGFSLSRWL